MQPKTVNVECFLVRECFRSSNVQNLVGCQRSTKGSGNHSGKVISGGLIAQNGGSSTVLDHEWQQFSKEHGATEYDMANPRILNDLLCFILGLLDTRGTI